MTVSEVAPNAEEIIEAIKTSGISSTPAAPGTRA